MLVLSRRVGEVIIAGPLTLTVLAVKGSQVRLGFEAPTNFPIQRAELSGGSKPQSLPPEMATDRLARLKAKVARDQAEIARLEAAIADQN